MLKRTMVLLSLTITIGALLLVVGCGGHNNTMPSIENSVPSRMPGNGSVTLLSSGSPAVIQVYDPDGLASITVRDSAGGRLYLFTGKDFPKGATTVKITLKNFGQVSWHWVAFVDMQWSADSAWKIYPNGEIVKLR